MSIHYLDALQYRSQIDCANAMSEAEYHKAQNEEIKKYANGEIDLMKNEINSLNAKLASIKIEKVCINLTFY